MLPKNKSRKHLLKKFKVYAGSEHPHEAQQPEPISLDDKEIVAGKASKKAAEKKPAKKVAAKTESKVEKEEKPTKSAEKTEKVTKETADS
jgi:hypothetical protein